MREIGSILTGWTPVLQGAGGNPTGMTYTTRTTRIIRIGQNLLALYAEILTGSAWTGGAGALSITGPTNIAGGFPAVNFSIAMPGVRLVNTGVSGELFYISGTDLVICKSNGAAVLWSDITPSTTISIQVQALIHLT